MDVLESVTDMNLSNISPYSLLNLLISPVPSTVKQFLLNQVIYTMQNSHLEIFDRLNKTKDFDYKFVIEDMSYFFYMKLDKEKPILKILNDKDSEFIFTSATIKAKMQVLLDLLEGKNDGDAEFFNRNLVIEGDTAAIVALRNALDGQDINIINDICSSFGSYKKIMEDILIIFSGKLNKISKKLSTLQEFILKPVAKKLDEHEAALKEINNRIDDISVIVSTIAKVPKESVSSVDTLKRNRPPQRVRVALDK